jgi:hypothetical protein
VSSEYRRWRELVQLESTLEQEPEQEQCCGRTGRLESGENWAFLREREGLRQRQAFYEPPSRMEGAPTKANAAFSPQFTGTWHLRQGAGVRSSHAGVLRYHINVGRVVRPGPWHTADDTERKDGCARLLVGGATPKWKPRDGFLPFDQSILSPNPNFPTNPYCSRQARPPNTNDGLPEPISPMQLTNAGLICRVQIVPHWHQR